MKRLSCLLFTVYCLLVFSCGQNNEQITIPANILPKEKMVQVITEVHIAEAQAHIKTLPDSTSTEAINFQKIFGKQSITKQQYEESLAFYIDHPVLLDSIYVQVLNELSKMQAKEQ